MLYRTALALTVAATLVGCDAFGERAETLAFETFLQSDTFIVEERPRGNEDAPFASTIVALQSAADTVAFARDYAFSGPLPSVDFNETTLVGQVFRQSARGRIPRITTLELVGSDVVRLTVDYEGVPRDGELSAYSVHLVATPRISARITGFESRPLDGGLGS